jgi:hypothetical protein
VLAAAALVVGVIGLVTVQRNAAPIPRPVTTHAVADELLVPDADKALCRDVGPLIREQSDRVSTFINTGIPESAERRAAIPKFRADTLEWYGRIQSKVNGYLSPQRYLTRTVQSYLDGMLLYSENLHDDRGPDAFDNEAYNSAVVYMGGPLAACYKLGVGW